MRALRGVARNEMAERRLRVLAKQGDRVGAILGSKDGVVRFLGYGTYQGMEVPPPEAGGFNLGHPNPKILLDSGKVVWGCECWWGAEGELRKWLKGCSEVLEVDIEEAREEYGHSREDS